MTARISAALACGLALWLAGPRAAVGAGAGPGALAAEIDLEERPGAELPLGLSFVDSSGRHVRLADYFDGERPVILVLAYARCRLLCNVVLRGVAEAIRAASQVAGRDYVPLVVSLDSRENPDEAARRQRGLLDAAGLADRAGWPYLVGDEPSVRQLAAALGFHYRWDPATEQYIHPAAIFAITPRGRIAEYLRGIEFPMLSAAIARAGRGEITRSVRTDLLRCFDFSPAARRYGDRIERFFQIGALALFALSIGAVASLTALVRRHGRRTRRSPWKR